MPIKHPPVHTEETSSLNAWLLTAPNPPVHPLCTGLRRLPMPGQQLTVYHSLPFAADNASAHTTILPCSSNSTTHVGMLLPFFPLSMQATTTLTSAPALSWRRTR